MKRLTLVIVVAMLAGCGAKVPPELLKHYTKRSLHTCCNLYAQGGHLSDANYRDGDLIPLGTPVKITALGVNSVTFEADGKAYTLEHLYGSEQEDYKTYFDKVFVEADRGKMVEAMPKIIRKAIQEGRVEVGMKRGEVVLAVGFPPTDDNPSPKAEQWKLWYSRGRSYRIAFDANGYVADVMGPVAPTRGKPVRVYATQ